MMRKCHHGLDCLHSAVIRTRHSRWELVASLIELRTGTQYNNRKYLSPISRVLLSGSFYLNHTYRDDLNFRNSFPAVGTHSSQPRMFGIDFHPPSRKGCIESLPTNI